MSLIIGATEHHHWRTQLESIHVASSPEQQLLAANQSSKSTRDNPDLKNSCEFRVLGWWRINQKAEANNNVMWKGKQREGGRKEGTQTHRVLHGRPPSLHGCEAVAEAVVPALAGVLLRLGRAQVHPHVAAQPNPPKHPPASNQHRYYKRKPQSQSQKQWRSPDPRGRSSPRNQTSRNRSRG